MGIVHPARTATRGNNVRKVRLVTRGSMAFNIHRSLDTRAILAIMCQVSPSQVTFTLWFYDRRFLDDKPRDIHTFVLRPSLFRRQAKGHPRIGFRPVDPSISRLYVSFCRLLSDMKTILNNVNRIIKFKN